MDSRTGARQAVAATAAVVSLLAQREPALRERLFRRPKSIEEYGEAQARYWGGPGHAWEGPRLPFTLLLGAGQVWNGPEALVVWDEPAGVWVCRFCRGAWLPRHAYCLGCDRTGRELEVPGVSAADEERRRDPQRVYRGPPAGLRGGRD